MKNEDLKIGDINDVNDLDKQGGDIFHNKYLEDRDIVKTRVKTFICSDYYIRYEKEQDVSKVESLDDVSSQWHLVADLNKIGLRIIATYDAKTEILTIRKDGLRFLIPSEFDPVRKFVKNIDKTYRENMDIAKEVVKKKVIRERDEEFLRRARILLEENPENKRWCKVCENWLPFTDEFFIPVKSKTNPRGCTYGHVCRRCKSKVDAACITAKRAKKRKEKEKKVKNTQGQYWKEGNGDFLVRGIPRMEREEFLVKLYTLVGLDFYEEMRKWKKHLIRTGKYEDVVMKYGDANQKKEYLHQKKISEKRRQSRHIKE